MAIKKLDNVIELVFFSKVYFEIEESFSFTKINKFWWKNVVIQIYKYKNKYFIICTLDFGIANASMTTTYILNKYKNIKYLLSFDFIDKRFTNLPNNMKITFSKNFYYLNADFSKFENTNLNQIFNEKKVFSFKSPKLNNIENFKMKQLELLTATSDSIKPGFDINFSLINSESCAIAQVAYKYAIDYVSFNIFHDSFPIYKVNSNNILKYFENIEFFKDSFYKIILYFMNNINWDINKISDSVFSFIIEICKCDNFNWLKYIIKEYKNIKAINKNTLLILNDNKKPSQNIEFLILNDEIKDLENNYFSYIYKKCNKIDNIFKNIKLSYESLLFTQSKFDLNKFVYKYYSNKIFDNLIEKSNILKTLNSNLIIKVEINYSFFIYNLKNKEVIDDNKISTSVFILKLLNELNKKLLK
ncbi:hypothetical protein [Spiroplasma endosymbiont of Atherix ibis]|uniref:hypothetical protein n=1 Tax=Spiroplasma endosymbiont of Atherix ibis TaxID=3066291 RepID=UPI0030D21953